MGRGFGSDLFEFRDGDALAFAQKRLFPRRGLKAFHRGGKTVAKARFGLFQALRREDLARAFQQGRGRILHQRLHGGTALCGHAELGTDEVGHAFTHEAVGGQLAAADGRHALEPFLFMVEDHEVAGSARPSADGSAVYRGRVPAKVRRMR